MDKVAGRDVVLAKTFILQQEELFETVATIGIGSFPVTVRFVPAKLEGEQTGEWHTKDGGIHITLTGWTNTLGASLVSPLKFGDADGRPLSFQVAAHHLGAHILAHLWIFHGELK